MANHFLDTSALVKHYHSEVGTPEVDRLWADSAARLYISRQCVVETVSVFARKVRSGAVAAADFALLRRRFPTLSSSQAFGLALWSIGIVLARSASLHAVVLALVCWLPWLCPQICLWA